MPGAPVSLGQSAVTKSTERKDAEDGVVLPRKPLCSTPYHSTDGPLALKHEQNNKAPPALVMTESRPPPNKLPPEQRVASLSVIVERDDAGNATNVRTRSPAKVERSPTRVPLMHAPPFSSHAQLACVQDFVSLAFPEASDDGSAAAASHCSFPVKLHVYDLTEGICAKYSEEFMGKEVPGMYHSAIVCYGMEHYFEGGIGFASEGHTRFGRQFTTYALGDTTIKPLDFARWVREEEETTFALSQYRVDTLNCHHFSRAAAAFLLRRSPNDTLEDVFPSFLFTTSADLIASPLGGQLSEALTLTTCGMQCCIARLCSVRLGERQNSLDILINAATACGVLRIPPNVTFLFRVADKAVCGKTLASLRPYTLALMEKGVVKPVALERIDSFVHQFVTQNDTLEPACVKAFVDVATEALVHSPYPLWGPILNGLRVAVLHKVVLSACVYHDKLSQVLKLGCRDFLRLMPDGRLALLRLLCNYGASTDGAMALHCLTLASEWVSAVGFGLDDTSHSAITYTASCLAGNMVIAATAVSPSVVKETNTVIDHHPLARLSTLILTTIKRDSAALLPEATFNNLLLALCRIMVASEKLLSFVSYHYQKMKHRELLDKCATNESRALICILKALVDLYM